MSKRPSQTLVLITPREMVRADFASGRILHLQRQPRPDFENFGMIVEAALLMGGKVAKDVWVLSSELWMQTIEMIAHLDGANKREQVRALCLEAEQYSGISGLDSHVGFLPMASTSGMRRFLVTQIRSEDLDEAERAVERMKGKLQGILHPAGLPIPLQEGGAPWERIEFWPDQTLAIQSAGPGKLKHMVTPGDPGQGRWRSEYDAWRGAAAPAHSEMLAATANLASEGMSSLEDDAALSAWLSGWSRYLTGKERAFPCIVPPKRPMAASTQRGIMGLLMLVAICACGGHYLYTDHAITKAKADAEKALTPSKTLTALDAQHKGLVKEREDLLAKNERMEHLANDMALQRTRVYNMLTKFAEHKGSTMLVQKVELEGGEPRVHGISLEPNQAGIFAKQVADALQPFGWQVQDLKSVAQNKLANGGPWVFELRLKDVLSSLPASMTATKGTKIDIER